MDTTFLASNGIAFEEDVSLKTKTWIKRGGIAQVWVQPTKISDFKKLIIWCQQHNDIIYEVIGNASNCYFLNDYNPDLVISTLKLKKIHVSQNTIVCDCGYNMVKLAKYCVSNGIQGFEGFTGVPGTVAGAAINNSGCLDSVCSKIVKSVKIIHDAKEIELSNDEMKYENRNSILKSKKIIGIVTQVTFNAERANPQILKKRVKEIEKRRKKFLENQYPNLGTTYSYANFKIGFLEKIIRKIIDLSFLSSVMKRKLKNYIFLVLRNTKSFRRYISKYNVQCFTWRDEEADKAFFDYMDFFAKNSQESTLEIEVKGKEKLMNDC